MMARKEEEDIMAKEEKEDDMAKEEEEDMARKEEDMMARKEEEEDDMARKEDRKEEEEDMARKDDRKEEEEDMARKEEKEGDMAKEEKEDDMAIKEEGEEEKEMMVERERRRDGTEPFQLDPSIPPTPSTPDSIPDSYTTCADDAASLLPSSPLSISYEDEDVNSRFEFPPKISRLGSIYSHLRRARCSSDALSSDSESDMYETRPKHDSLDTEPQKYEEEADVLDRKPKQSWSKESVVEDNSTIENQGDNDTTITLRRQLIREDDKTRVERDNQTGPSALHPTAATRDQTKRVPPAKPPRALAAPGRKDNRHKRRSREDPVRYENLTVQKLNAKKSVSMSNILEGNVEGDEACSRESQGQEREATGLLRPASDTQSLKRSLRTRSSFKYREAAKIVGALMSKRPPFGHLFHRRDALKTKNPLSKRRSNEIEKESPSSSPAEDKRQDERQDEMQEERQDEVETQATEFPRKPPRDNADVNGAAASLDKAQEMCPSHLALLNFYCAKCRVVVCRDCTVVAHSHSDNHQVLDTLDALATLRSDAATMLRHYTLLDTMHASLTGIYRRFTVMHRDVDINAIEKRLEEGKYLAEAVKEAEQMVTSWTNLHQIRECVRQWEERQDEWGDLVFLASRCALLTGMHIPSDTVFLRMGSWVMPTPWIQLSHLLQPYLRAASPFSPRKQHTRVGFKKALGLPSPLLSCAFATVASHRGGARVQEEISSAEGPARAARNQPFPYNARQVVLSNLIPYIILNPDIRYFVHVRGPRDADLTLVVVPVNDHARDSLKRRRNNSSRSLEVPPEDSFLPCSDAITLVEQQMTCGACKTRISASSMPLGPFSAPAIVKVSFSDVKVVSEGKGLPAVRGGVKRGDLVVEQSCGKRPILTVAVRDIGDLPALSLGHVTWGLDSLACLVGSEDSKRAEVMGFRAKIKATVRREEEAMYDLLFGMDL
ncbi:hypothetical protein GWK47_048015 [Chionoecetes opilio]|uniref:B box-type domain-containing protein n=1 Tax=Chionoecetes opilio TaxID=41210 RepID=A0A8J4Y5Q6_CHIOP|nr:hypothetical protein GWK47_048015 [Chionoecetes opilio]